MCECPACGGRFFRVMETRMKSQIVASEVTLYYRKKCKRCKLKSHFSQVFPGGETALVTLDEWLTAQPVGNGKEGRMQIMVSEYTRRISRAADRNIPGQKRGRM